MSTSPSPSSASVLHYPFGQRAAGLLGVSITSDGLLSIFARRVPLDSQGLFQWGSDGRMATIFETQAAVALPAHTSFSLELARYTPQPSAPAAVPTGKLGLFTIEPIDWPHIYEVSAAHMMGFTDPFTPFETDYTGTSRPPTVASNRKFTCTYNGRGDLLIDDVPHNAETTIHLHSFNQLDNSLGKVATAGGVFVAVRVTEAHLDDGCVTLTFPTGPKFDGVIHTPGQPDQKFTQLDTFKLNRTSYGPV